MAMRGEPNAASGMFGDPKSDSDIFTLPAPIAVERLGRYLAAIPAGSARLKYLESKVLKAPEKPLIRVLACAQRESAAGSVEGQVCVETFGAWWAEKHLPEARREQWRKTAADLSEWDVSRLLSEESEEVGEERYQEPKGSLAADGESLGRRKTLARTASGDLLDRILQDNHPDVIRNALLNPRVSEPLVVRLCARRPIPPELLRVVADSRFQNRLAVKRSAVQNPDCPLPLACQWVASMPRQDLLRLSHDANLGRELRETARRLLEEKAPKHPDDRF